MESLRTLEEYCKECLNMRMDKEIASGVIATNTNRDRKDVLKTWEHIFSK